ncbi:MAG: hypothetical protein Q4A28_06385 [Brachymonas sp.]|nr:hypothetical protein [Brachymonas sp.]
MNNPAAFPLIETAPNGSVSIEPGMALRDYFAAHVLPVIYKQTADDYDEGKINSKDADPKCMAHEAYKIADAMLAEREKGANK